MTKFLVGFIAVVAVGVWSSSSSATLLIYDPFNYTPAGQPLLGQTLNGTAGGFDAGTANTNSWLRAATNTTTPFINTSSTILSAPSPLAAPIGNSLALTAATGSNAAGGANRMGINQMTVGSAAGADIPSGTGYYSFLMNVTSTSGLSNSAGVPFFSLNNNDNAATNNNPTTRLGQLYIRADTVDATKYYLQIAENGHAVTSNLWQGPYSTGTTNFVVGSTTWTTSTNTAASLWVNPDPNSFGVDALKPVALQSDPLTTGTNGGSGMGSAMVIQQTGVALTFDELRVGTTWHEVTPIGTPSLYWDTNGTNPGAGSTPTGTWDSSTTANWNPDATGVNSPQTYTQDARVTFAAGSDASGAYTVTISGTQSSSSVVIKDGNPTFVSDNLNPGTLSLTGSHTVTVQNSGQTADIATPIIGSLGLIKDGAGTLAISGNDTYSGPTTISSGILQLGDGGGTGTLSTGSAITNSDTFAINRNNQVTQSTAFGTISGAGALVQAGAGTTTLDVANTYTGTTSATGGTLNIKNTLAVQNSVVVTDAGGSIAFDATMAGQNVTVGGLSSASASYTAPASMNLTINNANVGSTYAGAITGSGTLTKKGTFPQTLSGTNTYNGATSVNVGTLHYTQKAAMSAASSITVNGQSDWTVTSGTSTNFTGGILSVATDDGSSGTKWSNSATSTAGTIGGLINGIGGQGNSIVWSNGSSLGVDIDSGLGDPSTGLTYSGTIGNFHTISAPAGDFNHDNVVNAADYVVWRKGGSPNPNSAGDYNAWRSTYGATGGGSGTTNNVGFMKRGYGTLTLDGANTFSGQLKLNDEGGMVRLATALPNAGQSMTLPAVYIGGATGTTNTMLKVLTNNALPTNSLIRVGTGSGGFIGVLRLHDEDPSVLATIPTQSFNQTVRGISGGNGQIQVGGGTLTINTPTGETYSTSSRYRTDYDALGLVDTINPVDSRQHGTIIKTGAGEQDLNFFDTGGIIRGEFILQQGTVGVGNAQDFGGLNGRIVDPNNINNQLPWPRLTINGGTILNTSGGTLSILVPNVYIGGDFTFNPAGSNSQFSGGGAHTLTTLTASPTITVTPASSTSDGSGTFILPFKVQDDGTVRGFTKAGPGTLTLGGHDNSYRGDTVIQGSATENGAVRLSTGAVTAGEVPTLGNQTTPGRVVLAGGRLEMNSNQGTTFASEFSGNPYAISGTRTNIENNPIHVEAPNNNSTIAFTAFPSNALTTDDAKFVFMTNSFDWTSGNLTFLHNATNNASAVTFRPTFVGAGFDYAGPVTISNNGSNAGKTVLQSANTSGTQTWSNVISGNGSFLRDGAGGTTVLSGNNSYTGDTSVTGGLLSITHAYLADTADVLLSHLTDANAKLNLNFLGTDTIDELFFNGVATTLTGTWGSGASGATHQDDTYFSGTGMLLVSTSGGAGSGLTNGMSAVPEPATLSLLLLAIGPAMALRRRKR